MSAETALLITYISLVVFAVGLLLSMSINFIARPKTEIFIAIGFWNFVLLVFSGIVWSIVESNAYTIPGNTVVLNSNNEVVALYKKPRTLWITHRHWSSVFKRVSLDQKKEYVPMRLALITSNPKVRDFRYLISLETGGGIEQTILFCKSEIECSEEKLRKFIRKLMYEFNNKWSKKLEKFYNPEEATHQESFSNMVRYYLTPHLKDTGVVISKVRFSLP